MTRKRLLMVSPYFPPDDRAGGVETYALAVAEGLSADHAWDVSVLTTLPANGVAREVVPDTISVYRMPYRHRISNSPVSVSWPRSVSRLIADIDPDVLQVNMPVPGLADLTCLLAGRRPVVVYYHFGSMKKERLLPDLLIGVYEALFLPLTLHKATALMCTGSYVRDGILRRFREKAFISTPGVDLDKYHPAPHGLPAGRILYVGSLNVSDAQHKRFPDLLMAFKMLLAEQPGLRLTVVGGGDGLPAYSRIAAEMGLAESVAFRGRLSGKVLADAFREATVLAVPSLRETFGVVIIEAMASGLPVVAVGAGGIRDVIDDFRDGILVPPRDPARLADALKFVLSDPETAAAMGATGRRKVCETMGWPRQVAEMSQILNAAIRSANRTAAKGTK